MRKFVQAVCGTTAAGVILLLTILLYIQVSLPEGFSIADGEEFIINSKISITAANDITGIIPIEPKVYDADGNTYNVNISLRQRPSIPANATSRKMVIPGGTPFGIKMFSNGVIIVGMSDIQVGTDIHNPAKDAGLKVGDILTHIDGNQIEGNNEVAKIFSQSGGRELRVTVIRGGQSMDLYLSPIHSELEKSYKAGIWIRDSSAGIGTMTYYDPEIMGFAGLGHAICDVDTGKVMPLLKGEIVDVNISGAHAGQSGKPGELQGTFSGGDAMGVLVRNTECGIFGYLHSHYFGSELMPMALKQEIQPGPAQILATISGNKPQAFDIMVEKVNYSDINPTKNMVIRITDQKLLSATGGIVQGMSGSPIIQNGRLAGAVTHVFVNDPTRGYGIFVENMDKELKKIENHQIAA